MQGKGGEEYQDSTIMIDFGCSLAKGLVIQAMWVSHNAEFIHPRAQHIDVLDMNS